MDKINNFKNRLLGRSNTASGATSNPNRAEGSGLIISNPVVTRKVKPTTQRQREQTWTDIPLDPPPQTFQAHRLQGPVSGPQPDELAAAGHRDDDSFYDATPPPSPRHRAATVGQPPAPPTRRQSWEPQVNARHPIVAPDLSTEFLLTYQQPQGPRRPQTVRSPPVTQRAPVIERVATAKGSLKRFVSFSKYRDRFRERKDEQHHDLERKKLGQQQQPPAIRGLYQSNQDQPADQRFHGAQIIRTPSDAFQGLPSPHSSELPTSTDHVYDTLSYSPYRPETTAGDHAWMTGPGPPPAEKVVDLTSLSPIHRPRPISAHDIEESK
ncbi:uncharacterized protein PAC_16922 [Phialocephala subalpina]|uniref:Uncharacterized protein n=1 Tax=Phialocephala subalpina TaxID=576137 RepID=A0A1L7XPS8_9HELO|nr:uncharacterized protein PAC_16922 [Phialocephala subalpina]